MQSLDLTVDDETDARIRASWARLVDAGLPSQARHRGASNRPHVTLLTRPVIDIAAVAPAATVLPFPLVVGPVVVLGRGPMWAVARLVTSSPALRDLQEDLHAASGPGEASAFDAPHRWTPHITLARRVPSADVGRVLDALDDLGEIEATAVGIRHWDSVTAVDTAVE